MGETFLVRRERRGETGGGGSDLLPQQIRSFTAVGSDKKVTLSWLLPEDTTHYAGLLIVRKVGSVPEHQGDGVVLYMTQTQTSYVDAAVENNVVYYYRAFPYNQYEQHQTALTGAVVSASAGAPSAQNFLLGDLRIGALVMDPDTTYYGAPIVWRIADKNHEGYPANSVTLITDKIITLGCFDAKEPEGGMYISNYGNSIYKLSNVDQWLTSDAAAGAWYTKRHSTDQPPSAAYVFEGANTYTEKAGLLHTFSDRFKNALMDTTLDVKVRDEKGKVGLETINRKIFLASVEETRAPDVEPNPVREGKPLALFQSMTSRIAFCTPQAVSNNNYVDTYPLTVNTESPWWLRTFYPLHTAYNICIDGTLRTDNAYYGMKGIRPLCNLPASTPVSLFLNSEGVYIMG